MKNVIKVNHLVKKIGEQIILSDVNCEFESGKIYGLMGRNGSGKTVFLKCLCGFMQATEGEIYLNDKRLKKDMEYMENLGFLIEHPGFMENVSGFKNLKYIASINKIATKEDILDSLKYVDLDPLSKKSVGKYSLGMKQRLGVAQAIMENPDILILDEPMNGLDESGVKMMRKLLNDLRNKGKLIIIASHYKEDIDMLCDKVLYCKNCKIQELTELEGKE
ncbi:MAG: ATP-binding cassette domain-containing protein [Lachnospiraceae bacterium]|nr:ATP-binding cassette domain-containing protein [Lachnospiraceae bacterium]